MKKLTMLMLMLFPTMISMVRFPKKKVDTNTKSNAEHTPIVHLYTNHKTGTALAHAIAKESPFFVTSDIHWAGSMPAPRHQQREQFVVNFIRDPFHLVLSAYEYHKGDQSKPEEWTNVAMRIDNHYNFGGWQGTNAVVREANLYPTIFDEQDGSKPALSPILARESYRDYLRRIPLKQGLLAEIVRSLQRDLPFVLESYRSTLEPSNEISVCIEWLSESPSCFQATWEHVVKDVFKIEGFNSSTVTDPRKHFHQGAYKLDESEKMRLLSDLHDLDSRLFK
eukprot:gene25444-31075_t